MQPDLKSNTQTRRWLLWNFASWNSFRIIEYVSINTLNKDLINKDWTDILHIFLTHCACCWAAYAHVLKIKAIFLENTQLREKYFYQSCRDPSSIFTLTSVRFESKSFQLILIRIITIFSVHKSLGTLMILYKD